ncbi:MAG: translocation protein TolB [Schlesneria sp.]|nr:translocation protein TolB [Schlesneria sp.]
MENKWHVSWRRDFRIADQNGDGRLSLSEFRCLPTVARPEERGVIADPVGDWVEQKLKLVTEAVYRKGREGDDGLRVRDWPVAQVKEISADLGAISAKTWDRDSDGSITSAECRILLEIAYGIRKADGSTLRLPTGRMVNMDVFRQFDTNRDGTLSQAEVVDRKWMKLELFQQRDLNHNGQLNWSEFTARPEMTIDPLEDFAGMTPIWTARSTSQNWIRMRPHSHGTRTLAHG